MWHVKLTSAFIRDMRKGFFITWNAGKKYALYNTGLSLITALLPLVSLWYIKKIIDIIAHYDNAAKEDFIYTVAILVIIQLAQAALQHFQNDIQTVQQQLCIDYLTRKVLEKAINVEYPYYENPNYYNTLHQAQQEVIYKTALLTSGFNQVMQNGLSLFFLSALFLRFNWLYGIIVIAAGIPVLYIKWKHTKAAQDLEKNNIIHERKASYLNRILTDAVHAKEVRTYFFGEFFIEKFNDLRQSIFNGKKKLSSTQARAETLIQSVEILMLAVIIINLGLSTLEGAITAGSFIFYFQALQRLQSGFRNFLTGITTLLKMSFFLKNLHAFLDLDTGHNIQGVAQFPADMEAGIKLQDVSFTYPGSDKPVLQHVDMLFRPGKVTAIVGENGSGKSTLVKLLGRLYQPGEGTISINGLNVELIHPKQYSANVAVLFQDYNQYHFSLAENILLGQRRDHEQLDYSAIQSGVDEIAQQLSKGYDTSLGKMFGNDAQLSGGQWQKIAIARMLYRQTPVIILDEPTSNIDPLAEYDILKRITAGKKDSIIILITHRLHNLKFADHIYVMDHGNIHGEGTTDELLANDALFRQMYERQELGKMDIRL
jgi:ATP-binding cassette subfamily B protein